MLLCDTGKPGLLRYYFCWPSLCYSAAWWLSPRQCIITPMRTIIIRAVWMGRHDVEMQTWCWRSTQGRFSKMNKYKKLFFLFTLAQNWTSLDIYVLLKVTNWSHQQEKTSSAILLLTENGVHEQHFSSIHIWGELGIVDLGFLCLFVTLYEDLANADRAAAITETLLHGLACEKAHETQLWLKGYSNIFVAWG